MLSRTAVLSAELGLFALSLDLVAFALFGPAFRYADGLILFLSAASVGLVAILLSHRSGHHIRRNASLQGQKYSTIGSVTGWTAVLVGTGYIGLLHFLLLPPVTLLAAALGSVAIALHATSRAGEARFRRTTNLGMRVAACALCGRPVPFSAGRWDSRGWLCPACFANSWGFSG